MEVFINIAIRTGLRGTYLFSRAAREFAPLRDEHLLRILMYMQEVYTGNLTETINGALLKIASEALIWDTPTRMIVAPHIARRLRPFTTYRGRPLMKMKGNCKGIGKMTFLRMKRFDETGASQTQDYARYALVQLDGWDGVGNESGSSPGGDSDDSQGEDPPRQGVNQTEESGSGSPATEGIGSDEVGGPRGGSQTPTTLSPTQADAGSSTDPHSRRCVVQSYRLDNGSDLEYECSSTE